MTYSGTSAHCCLGRLLRARANSDGGTKLSRRCSLGFAFGPALSTLTCAASP
jgi:hypothetical protein